MAKREKDTCRTKGSFDVLYITPNDTENTERLKALGVSVSDDGKTIRFACDEGGYTVVSEATRKDYKQEMMQFWDKFAHDGSSE